MTINLPVQLPRSYPYFPKKGRKAGEKSIKDQLEDNRYLANPGG
jgi:hypothetical protein